MRPDSARIFHVMNNLFLHIDYLLLRHNCVVVPGFGAFICRHIPASIDMLNGCILPSSKEFAFNRAIYQDDGLLVNSYSRKYGITSEEAHLAIARAVASLRNNLASGERISCGRIGSLSIGDEENILFSPASENPYSGSLPEVPLSFSHTDNVNESEATVSEDEISESNYYHIRINKTFAHVAAMVIAVVAIGLAVMFNPIPSDNREQRASVVPVESMIKIKDDRPAVAADSTAAASETISPSSVESTEEEVIEPKFHFHHLIVGTFSSEREANSFAEKCECGSYKLKVVPSKKLYRVAAASSDSKDELRGILNSQECRGLFPNAWIWSEK